MTIVKLGDVCDFYNGGTWSSKEYVVHGGLPVLKVTNCKLDGFSVDDICYLSIDSKEKYEKNLLKIGDVIIATVGSHANVINSAAGHSCVVNSFVDGFYLNQNAVCLRSKNNDVLSQKYLGYVCKHQLFQNFIQNNGRGAANQMRIAISSIKEYTFELPSIEIQRRIADILSAYDDLIENNQKQIRLLEEAAQRLYKEWFVDLRFPGHEHAKIIDGVPEGWLQTPLSTISPFSRGKTITKMDTGDGKIPVVAGGLEPAYYHNKSNTCAPVITVSGSGVNAGFVRIYFQNIWASDCSYVDNSMTNFLYFTFCFMKSVKKGIDNLKKGSAQPHVYAKDLNDLKLFLPTNNLLSLFEELVTPLFTKISVCSIILEQSKNARDSLLPKLMNGEINVEAIS